MADKKTRTTLENQFASGKIPTESNFAELIASGINQMDDGLQKAADTPLAIRTTAPADGPRDMVLLFEDFQQPDPLWRIRLRSGSLELSKGTNANADFLIDKNGNVGIGTTDPKAKLDIQAHPRTLTHPAINGLYVTGNFDADKNGVEFRHSNGTQGIGFGYNSIYATGGNADQHLNLLPKGKGYVGIGTTEPIAKLQVVGGAIMPAEGPGEAAGILFKPDAFKGGGDRAYIRYYARSGESTTLEIGNLNDTDDHIALIPGGNVGIGTTNPGAKLHVEGAIMEKLDVINCGGRGDWTAQNHPIMLYFRGKLAGKPIGTYIKAIQDNPGWRGHYWQGWVDVDSRIRVIHNSINTSAFVA